MASAPNTGKLHNINWEIGGSSHPIAKDSKWVFAKFRGRNFASQHAFGTLGILEFRRNNFFNSMRLLIQSVNNGRYTPDVKLRTGNITDNLGMYLAMAMKKNGNINEYQRYQKAINDCQLI